MIQRTKPGKDVKWKFGPGIKTFNPLVYIGSQHLKMLAFHIKSFSIISAKCNRSPRIFSKYPICISLL